MPKESIEKQRKPYKPIVALDKAALPHVYTLGVAEAYRRALRELAYLFPAPPVKQQALF